MILLPLALTIAYLCVARTLFGAGEPDNYDKWCKEPNDLEIIK